MAHVSVDIQPTPNPNAMKFNLSVKVLEEGSKSYTSKEAAAESPLASRIFELEGVTSVFMLGQLRYRQQDGRSVVERPRGRNRREFAGGVGLKRLCDERGGYCTESTGRGVQTVPQKPHRGRPCSYAHGVL